MKIKTIRKTAILIIAVLFAFFVIDNILDLNSRMEELEKIDYKVSNVENIFNNYNVTERITINNSIKEYYNDTYILEEIENIKIMIDDLDVDLKEDVEDVLEDSLMLPDYFRI